MMRISRKWLVVPAVAVLAACGRDAAPDSALKNDLALASQASPYAPQAFTSPAEAGYGYNPYAQYNPYNPYMQAPQPQYQAPMPVQRVQTTTTARRSTSSGTRSSGTYSVQQPQRTRVVKNTKRDAAIGAVAGAVIGAAASRDKVKGGLIGAAIGGVLGGVIGNNVDVKRIPY